MKKTLLEFKYFVEAGKLWDDGVLESQGQSELQRIVFIWEQA